MLSLLVHSVVTGLVFPGSLTVRFVCVVKVTLSVVISVLLLEWLRQVRINFVLVSLCIVVVKVVRCLGLLRLGGLLLKCLKYRDRTELLSWLWFVLRLSS